MIRACKILHALDYILRGVANFSHLRDDCINYTLISAFVGPTAWVPENDYELAAKCANVNDSVTSLQYIPECRFSGGHVKEI